MHPFDAAIQLSPEADHRFGGATHPGYANMVGPFGGVTAAAMLGAVMRHPERQGEPIALTVNFAAPLAEGPYQIEARPVRTNRSTQHWLMQLWQDDAVAVTATAALAQRRPTWSATEAQPPHPLLPAVDSVPAVPQAPGRPAWVSRYDMRFIEGGLPDAFDGVEQPGAHSLLWIRDEPARPLDFPALTALCDSFFPRVFLRRRALTPIGTVSFTVHFHADAAQLAAQGARHVAARARALNYRNGYFDQTAEIWSDSGELLAATHQMVYFRG